jgi:ABC-type polysaccharide/polyol phosphate transport system ATPase subunit
MKKSLPAIELRHVSKHYVIHHEKPTLVEKLIHDRVEKFTALDDVSLTVYRGERIGIIGSNGSGKTTLLKIISGIATPSAGTILVSGKIVSLIDLEAGFHGDLSGLENIYLNAMLIGLNNAQIRSSLSDIIDFSELGSFIDAPLYTYSQGMKLKLGFSIAIHSDPDILIIDEGIAVGDAKFQEKAAHSLSQFMVHGNKTILIASHWMEYIRKYCSRVITLQSGKIVSVAKPDTAISRYTSGD